MNNLNVAFNHKVARSQVGVWSGVEDPEVRAEHGGAGQDGHCAQVARGVAVVGGAEHSDHALLVTPAS